MTTEEKKKILNALKVVREECTKHDSDGCLECPLCTDEGCQLKIISPRNWHLANEKKNVWRAFSQ